MPGAEVRHPGADESWLIQKHRDVVHDYSDLSSSEKEYIKEWDAFIQNKHIVSEAFIDRAVIDFVKDKMGWLLDRTCRLHELGKHVTVLVARGLDDNTIKMVRHRIQEARAQRSTSRVGRVFPSAPMEGLKRISGGCAFCGRLVRGPGLLNCSNEVISSTVKIYLAWPQLTVGLHTGLQKALSQRLHAGHSTGAD